MSKYEVITVTCNIIKHRICDALSVFLANIRNSNDKDKSFSLKIPE
jgi:hypothetical protein